MVRPTRLSMVRPTGLRGRGRVFFQWFSQRAWKSFVFQWFAQRAWRGFVFQWSAQQVCGVGVGFFFNGSPNAPGGVSFFNGPPNGNGGFVFQWSAQCAWRGFVFQWSAQRARGVRFSMVRPTGLRGRGRVFFFNGSPNAPGGVSFFNGSPNAPGGFRFSMVRPTGLRGRGRVFFQWFAQRAWRGFVFQWFAQRAREGFRIFFSMVRPTGPGGVSDFFFNGPPNGPGRGFVFQWSAQRAREGFRFSMVRPTGLRGRGRFFSMVRPTGPGGVSDLFFQWSAQRAREGFRIFFSMVRQFRIFFFNGPPNGPGRGFVFQWSAQRAREGFRFSMVRPTGLEGSRIFFEYWSAQRAWGVSFFRPYMYVHPGVIAFLHGFARFAHASPRSFDWFAQPVGFLSAPNQKKGLEQAPGIPTGPLNVSTPFSSMRQKGSEGSLDAGRPEECLKKSFSKASRGSWASEAPGSRPAASQSSAGPPRCRCPAAPAAPASAGSPGPPCCGRSWSPRPPAAARRRTEG